MGQINPKSSQMSDLTITCAFTAFNCENTIVAALHSAISQTYSVKKILVVDDCSQDDTVNLITKTLSDSNIQHRIIKLHQNMGVGFARNVLLNECDSEFIAFFDDDDTSHPRRLEFQYQYLTSFEANNPNLISPVCYSGRMINYDNGSTLMSNGFHADLNYISSIHIVHAILSCTSLPSNVSPGHSATSTLFARTKTINSVGGFYEELKRFEDVALAIKLILNGSSLISHPEYLVQQQHTETEDKKHFYKYNHKLITLFRHLYPSKRHYNFAHKYISMKNNILYESLFIGVIQAILLLLRFPLLTIIVCFDSLSSIIFSQKHSLLRRKYIKS